MDVGHIANINGSSALVRAHRNHLNVGDVLDVAQTPNHILPAGKFHHAPTYVVVATANGVDDPVHRQVVSKQSIRIQIHLILLNKAAHTGHFGNPRHRFQPVTHIPVLERAQLGKVMLAGPINQSVFERPTHPGCVRSESWCDSLGKLARGFLHVFEHPRTGPVHVGSVLEDYVHEGQAKKGVPSHDLHLGRREERGNNRVGHLVFHQVGTASFPLSEDNYLDIRQVGDGIERSVVGGPDPPGNSKESSQKDIEFVVGAPRD